MRLLFTSDWQVHFSNMLECELSLEELLAAADKYKPAVIIHGGDMKEDYSPVDVEVVKFAVRAVRRIREAGHRFIINLGNHDRISQSSESKDWLDVLAAAGAEVVTKPAIKKIGNLALCCLPFTADREMLIKGAKALLRASAGHHGPKILLFHTEIAGAVLNSAGRLGHGPTPEELGFDQYDACFGGHIHNHQRISENSWYIGAPFAQDWGDANSSRGHLLVDVVQTVGVKQLRTDIPHWYDVGYLEENKITPEAGAYIRSKVPVTSRRITDQLREEEERIRAKYGEVRVHTVPVLVDETPDQMVLKGATDREKIEQYVAATITEQHRFEPAQAVSYMESKLQGLKEGAQGGDLHFVGVEAHNVLVFEDVKMRLEKLGLVLVRGESEDWPGRSNGTGKSSLLSLVPIAMFGVVPNKKQKADAWAYERDEAPATVRLLLQDAAKRKIEIIRGRRPHLIQLRIDGEDKSSGIRGTGKNETQGLIEQVTGYDMQMLMNAVYIDQAVANSFVFGTPSGRMDLIARFQNLERFDKALAAVGADYKRWEGAVPPLTAQIELWEQEIDGLKDELHAIEQEQKSNWGEQLKEEQAKLGNLVEQHAALSGVAATYAEMQRELDDLLADRHRELADVEKLDRQVHVAKDRAERGRELVRAGQCPTCAQPTKNLGDTLVKSFENKAKEIESIALRHRDAVDGLDRKVADISTKLGKFQLQMTGLEGELSVSRGRVRDLQKVADEEAERNQTRAAKIERMSFELALKKRYRRAAVAARQELIVGLEMLEYAKKAFHRSGIPLYLSVGLCPLLNQAADEYSEIFTDGKLKVTFRVEDGEFVVDVVNPVGSGTTEGQSAGESAMAGLIAAFSVREAAPKTNLLILDEPGTHLDPEGCRQFARGILKLKDRFETIMLVTHNAYIASLLSGETVYTVRKRSGRSKLYLSSRRG